MKLKKNQGESMAFFSGFLNRSSLLLGVLIVAYLVPIWLFAYFPTQDGVSHVYNSQILSAYNNPSYEFGSYYEINWYPFPNWLSHFSLAVLMFIFPPLIAEKVFLSLYVILFPLSMRYFLSSVRAGRDGLVILSFTFIYNYLFLMGFYNFAVSVPLFLLVLGYWYRNKEGLTLKRGVVLNVLIVTTYFAHLISYVFVLFSIGLLAVLYFRKSVKRIVSTCLYVLPSALLLLVYLPTSDLFSGGEPPEIGFGRVGELLKGLLSLQVLIAFNEHQQWICYGVVGILIYLAFRTLLSRRGSGAATWGSGSAFLLLFGVLLGLYLIVPDSIGPGGWVNDRLGILGVLVLFAWFRESDKVWERRIFTGIVTALAFVNVLYVGYLCRNLNVELREFNAFVGRVEPNSVILPLHFEPRGESLKVGIFVNAANYYCLDNGCINLGNYEVQFDYFPVRFTSDFEAPTLEKEWVQTVHWRPEEIDLCGYADNVDYLLLWGEPDEPIVADAIGRCYTLLSSSGRLKLFRSGR